MRKIITAFVLATMLLTEAAAADPKPTSPGELRIAMRRLWDDQLVFTRNFIISTLAMDRDQGPCADYLLQHQTTMADALMPYYGDEASARLAALLRTHAELTAELVRSISAGEIDTLARQRAYWVGNVQEIAAYLATLNPRWKREQLERRLETYLELTMDEIAGRSIRNWEVELAAYERVRAHSTRLADFLSNGIIQQHPERFR
jgi:hypothetical protein